MMPSDILALPMLVPLRTVNGILGVSHSFGYQNLDDYPVPLEKIGNKYYARKVDVLRKVGMLTSDISQERVYEPGKTYRVSGKFLMKLQDKWFQYGIESTRTA
jgi:hypothetical protein